MGTYGYMPPEQFGGRTKPASDLYSLGATLIYLVTAMHPTELPQQDLQIQFRKFADINIEFADWLEWMTEPSLNQRFLSAHLALESIDNPQPRTKAIVTRQLLDKPYNTQIALKKTDERLEINIQPKGFSVGLIAIISILTPFSVGIHSQEVNLFNLFELLAQRSISFSSSLYLIFQLFTLVILIRLIIVALFKETHVLITAQDVTIIHKILWFKRRCKYSVNISTKSEVKITSNLNYEQFKYELLLIVSGIKVLNFNKHTNLSDYESKWLVQEIGNWLTKS